MVCPGRKICTGSTGISGVGSRSVAWWNRVRKRRYCRARGDAISPFINSFNVSHILALTVFLYHNIIRNLIERNGGENCEEK